MDKDFPWKARTSPAIPYTRNMNPTKIPVAKNVWTGLKKQSIPQIIIKKPRIVDKNVILLTPFSLT